VLFKMGIRKLRRWEVFGGEGFGACRARDWVLTQNQDKITDPT